MSIKGEDLATILMLTKIQACGIGSMELHDAGKTGIRPTSLNSPGEDPGIQNEPSIIDFFYNGLTFSIMIYEWATMTLETGQRSDLVCRNSGMNVNSTFGAG